MKWLAVAAVGPALALLAFGALSCQEESAILKPTPVPAATPDWAEVREECNEAARQATEAQFETEAAAYSDHFYDFRYKVEEVGDPFGVPLLFLAPEFDDMYERLFGLSPWEDPEAHRFYERTRETCLSDREYEPEGDVTAFVLERRLTPADLTILECIATLIIKVEAEHGQGSLGYTTAYKNFAWNRPHGEDEEVDLLALEKLYQDVTGRSPFISPEAMEAFRTTAAGCPEG